MLKQEGWITTLRQFLSISHLQLHIPQLKGVEIQRAKDQIIMDNIIQDTTWTDNDIMRLNRCRIYLRVTTIADLTNAAGTQILSSIYFCMEEGRLSSTDHWPYQPRPGPHHRATWQKYMDTLCLKPTLELKTTLGRWQITPPHLSLIHI